MSEGRLLSEWDRTSLIVAKIHNVNCVRRGDQISDPGVLNPLRQRTRKVKLTVAQARQMITGRKN